MESNFPPPAPPTVDSLVGVAHQKTAQELEAELGLAVLVGPDAESGDDDDDPWAFSTVSIGSVLDDGTDPADSFRESVVFGIKKKRPGPFADTILVGRSSSNDICIPDQSLSKLHARIHMQPEGGMVVTDSGSKNGTKVNGRRLGDKDRPEVRHGDEVQFGTRTFKVYATARLHTVLGNLVPS